MLASLRRFYASADGATAVEYGLLVAAIGLVVAVTITTAGEEVARLFETVEFPQ